MTQDCQWESASNCWKIPNKVVKSHVRQGKNRWNQESRQSGKENRRQRIVRRSADSKNRFHVVY